MVLAVVLCSGFFKDTLEPLELQFMLCLWLAWAMTVVTVSSVRVLKSHETRCERLSEAEREHFEILKRSLAMARLRGCPFSAKNPVVVQSSPEFDELFGGPMQGMSLGEAFVAHGQTLKGSDMLTHDCCRVYLFEDNDFFYT